MKYICIALTGMFTLLYVFTNPVKKTYTSQNTLAASITRGAEVYRDFCIQCHLGNGEGVSGTFPPLANSNWLTPERYKEAIAVVKYGQSGKITVNGIEYNGTMANLELYDDEVADVMNYIMNNWENSQITMITPDLVKKIVNK